MYPALLDSPVNNEAIVTLPDGRTVWAYENGYIEGDTNAFSEGEFILRWDGPGGEDLTDVEFNQVIEFEGKSYYLHEYVSEVAKWEHSEYGYDEGDCDWIDDEL